MTWLILSLFLSGPAHAFKAKKASDAELVTALTHDEVDDRIDAIAEMERRGMKESGADIAQLVRTDPVPGVRKKGLAVLEKLRWDGLYDLCGEVMVSDEDDAIRAKAMAILEDQGPSSFSPSFGQVAQSDADEGNRRKAVIIIGKRGWADQQEAVLAATRDSAPKVQHQAWIALIRLGDEAMRPAVHVALKEGDEQTREQIAKVLGEAPLAIDKDPLVAALDDPDLDVRVLAARSLGKLGDASVGPLLREKSNKSTDEKEAVEFAKAAALLGS